MEEYIGGGSMEDTRSLIRQKNSDMLHNLLHKGIDSHSVDIIKELKNK